MLSGLDATALAKAAAASSGVTDRRGDVKRWRVAKAGIHPAATVGNVAKGVGSEVVRQKRERTSCETHQLASGKENEAGT